MRFAAPFLFAVAGATAAPAAAPPKIDLKKGVEFIGRAEATVVDIRPRVTGYLDRVLVKEGAAVRRGDVLAEIDDRPYKLKLNAAKAELAVAQAQGKIAAAELAQIKVAIEKGIVSKDELAKVEAGHEAAQARIEVAKAVVNMAELDLSWTRLISPIDGRVRPFSITAGNLLVADGPPVTSVVADGTITVAFDVDERTLLAIRRALPADAGKPKVEVGLSDEDGFPHTAALELIDPQLDPKTTTVRFRATLANPKGVIAHNSFVRVRLTYQPDK